MRLSGELISFLTHDKLLLSGFLTRSKRPTKNVIIHIPGMTGSFYDNFTLNLAKLYKNSNCDFLAISTRGSNIVESFDKKKGKKWKYKTIGMALEKFEKCIYDIEGAIELCKKLGYKKIFLQGHSTGCQKITYYQAKRNDARVNALILLAPADDLNINKKTYGKRFSRLVKTAKKLSRKKDPLQRFMPTDSGKLISAERFLSFADEKNTEAQLFDYVGGRFKLFRKIKVPIIAVFGSREQYRTMPVSRYLRMLQKASISKKFTSIEIAGANHGFKKKEKMLVERILKRLES